MHVNKYEHTSPWRLWCTYHPSFALSSIYLTSNSYVCRSCQLHIHLFSSYFCFSASSFTESVPGWFLFCRHCMQRLSKVQFVTLFVLLSAWVRGWLDLVFKSTWKRWWRSCWFNVFWSSQRRLWRSRGLSVFYIINIKEMVKIWLVKCVHIYLKKRRQRPDW